VRKAAAVLIAFALALAGFGWLMMEKQAASAAQGGGLMGGMGEITIGCAILVGIAGVAFAWKGRR
jgi:hypothetical protein